MTTISQTFTNNLVTNLQSNLSGKGLAASTIALITGAVSGVIAPLAGPGVTGAAVAVGVLHFRNIEGFFNSIAFNFNSGPDGTASISTGSIISAVAGLALATAAVSIQVPSIAAGVLVGLGTVIASAIAGAVAQALYDTAVQHFPEIVDWLNENIVQPLNDFADILDQHLDNLIHSTLDYFSDLRLPFKSALSQINIDPLVLDLDGDGIELISPASSNAHLDYGGDGFAERTGWVKADDGILVFDRNANGTVDGIGEMFGSATQDGFEVLETLDTNADGKIDAADADFASLRVWQDANEDGISDAGELKTLAELGIASVSVNRTDVTGTNEGHDRGFAVTFTLTDRSTRRQAQSSMAPLFTVNLGLGR